MSRPKLVIWGASPTGHGLVVLDALLSIDQYEIVGFIDDNPDRHGEKILGHRILGGKDHLPQIARKGLQFVFPAVGDNKARSEMGSYIKELSLKMPHVFHHHAHVSPYAVVDEGVFVAAGAVVAPGVRLRKGSLVNTCASADHNCVLEPFSSICPGVHLAGRVSIGEGAFVGTGASVIPDVKIGAWAVVAAGACVTKDVQPGVTVMGVPARAKRTP